MLLRMCLGWPTRLIGKWQSSVSTVMAPEGGKAAAEAEPALALPAALVGACHLQWIIACPASPPIDQAVTPVRQASPS